MTDRELKEMSEWRTKAEKYKKELDELIREKLSRKDYDLNNEKELRDCKELNKTYELELRKERVPRTTLGQKIVLLDHFKVLDFMVTLNLNLGDLYKLLSYVLDADEKETSTAFNDRGKHEDSPLNNISNNKFLVKVFQEFKMKEDEEWAQNRLDKLKNANKSRKNTR